MSRRGRAALPLLAVALVVAPVIGCGDRGDGRALPAATEAAPAPTTTSDEAAGAPVATRPAGLDALDPPAGAAPTALRIDGIGVDAEVVPVGVAADGSMEVPAADQVGWYRYGPVPGAAGSAVLAAHVDYDGRRGAFFDLSALRPGDAVVVDGPDGTRRYRVTETRQVAKADLAASGVFDRSGEPRLALITCGGDFDATARSYRDNVVVQAVPEA